MSEPKEFSAMVLSAGFGSRLRPLTDEIPKPLLPVGDQPLLGIALRRLREAGALRLIVNIHHRADQIERFIKGLPFKVHVSHEEQILGTAGGIAAARPLVDAPRLVIVNGDIVGELPIDALLAASDPGLVMALSPVQKGTGTVGLDAEGNVVRLRGERFGTEAGSADYMGVAVLGEECLATLPSEGCLIGDWALPRLREGARLRTVIVPQSFEDIGTPGDYLAANLRWLSQREGVAGQSYLGEGVRVSDEVKIIASVVGEGAEIIGKGRVVASLLLPGARARAPLSDAIVTPSGQVISAGEGRE